MQGESFVELMSAASIDSKTASLSGLSSTLRILNPEVDITAQALMQRINNPSAATFLKKVFQKVLEIKIEDIAKRVPPNLLQPFSNVWIEDCSECMLHGALQNEFKGSGEASKSSVKIDLIYEMKQKNIHSVDLVDRRSPDQKLAQKHLDIVGKGDLVIRDLGFFDSTVLNAIDEAEAFFLSRLPGCVNVYLNKDDEVPTDIAKYLSRKFPSDSVIEIPVFISTEKVPCRMIAYRAPQEVVNQRRRAAIKTAKKKGRTPTEERLRRLDFTFFLTNVPVEILQAEVVGTLYTVRWQLELIFKNWKSSLQINYLKGTDPNRIRCLLYGKLIMITLMNLIYKLLDWYAQQTSREISLHKVVNWLKRGDKFMRWILRDPNLNFIKLLEQEILKTLCKDKRKQRKTTEQCLNMAISYEDIYVKYNGNKPVRTR